MAINIHIHHHEHFDDDKFLILTQKLNLIMATIQELNAKADALQTALDTEQQQIADAIAGLQQAVVDLQALVAEGGTAEERQAVSDKLDTVIADLQATIPDQA